MKEIEGSNLIREKLSRAQGSPLKTYMDITVGRKSLWQFLVYEILTSLLGPLPGGIGFYLRKKMYTRLFRKVGKGLIIGRNVVLRHPDKIELGENVTIDDNCLIDARGAGDKGLVLEDSVILNRNCMVQAKAGPIRLGRRTSIGCNSVIISMVGVELGENILAAGGLYLSAGSYHFDKTDKAVMDQGAYSKGPIKIGANAWLGTRVTVLDGVAMGDRVVIGASSLVNKDIPDNAVAFGVPCKVRTIRDIYNITADEN